MKKEEHVKGNEWLGHATRSLYHDCETRMGRVQDIVLVHRNHHISWQ